MAIGDRIRIATEKEYRIMSPPRRPRGEKPQTTIRYQRRVIATMQARIEILARDIESKTALAAELDRRLSAIPLQIDDIHAVSEELDKANDTIDRLTVEALHKRRDIRLSFLEGYYAKSTETNPRTGPGNTSDIPHGTPHPQEEGPETATGRPLRRPGNEIWRFGQDDPAYTDRRPMGEREIGAAHDATGPELARHRR